MRKASYSTSVSEQHLVGSLSSAKVVLPILLEYYQPRSVVDVGCGLGAWLKVCEELGVTETLGIDGPYIDPAKLVIDPSHFLPLDLMERVRVGRRFDLAMSLEVAEHLPLARAESFVADLVDLSEVVLFSAAVPFQGGTNHINEQWLEYWAVLFESHGYTPCDIFRRRIWGIQQVDYWYRQNVVIFCEEKRAAEIFGDAVTARCPLSVVHPLTFLLNVTRYRPLSPLTLDSEFEKFNSLVEAYFDGRSSPALPGALSAGETELEDLCLRARAVMADPQAEIEARDADISRLSSQLAACDQLRGEVSRCNSEIEILQRQLAEQSSQIERLRQQAARSSMLLDSVYRSVSWRITAPGRGIARRLVTLLGSLKR